MRLDNKSAWHESKDLRQAHSYGQKDWTFAVSEDTRASPRLAVRRPRLKDNQVNCRSNLSVWKERKGLRHN